MSPGTEVLLATMRDDPGALSQHVVSAGAALALREIELLRRVVTQYCDRSRIATVEPMDVQQAIDRAFETICR